ncbi:MAG: hypothetical protein AAF480_10395 [Actinomycetota bacterium]
MKKLMVVCAAMVLVAAACGGDDDDGSVSFGGDGAPEIEVDAEDFIEDPEGAAEELAEQIEERQEAVGGGSATLTVGDQTWTFSSVLCAFGEDEIGQEGAEFVLSSIQDGMQMYASIDSFGHSVSLDDIEDFENPKVSLSAFSGEFIELDGKNVRAEAEFADGTSDDFAMVAGVFEATCP